MTAKLKICGVTRVVDLAACVELEGLVGAVQRLAARVDEHADALGPAAGRHHRAQQRCGLGEREAAARTRPQVDADRVDPELDARREVDDPDAPPLTLPYTWVVRGAPPLGSLVLPTPAPARVLLDAAAPGYGGAGQTTDWVWARAAAQRLAAPVWLAGGITPGNAAAALAAVGPVGLDVASGAELPGAGRGEKDRTKIVALLAACRASD